MTVGSGNSHRGARSSAPPGSTPWICKTFFARSSPIVVTSFMDGSYFPVVDDNHTLAHRDAVGWEPSTASKARGPVHGQGPGKPRTRGGSPAKQFLRLTKATRVSNGISGRPVSFGNDRCTGNVTMMTRSQRLLPRPSPSQRAKRCLPQIRRRTARNGQKIVILIRF